MVNHVESIAEADHTPIVVHYSGRLATTTWSCPAPVVLQSTHDVIKRKSIVRMNLVKLAERDVVNRLPRFTSIVTYSDTSTLTFPQSCWILGIQPQGVIVDMRPSSDRAKSFPTINGCK